MATPKRNSPKTHDAAVTDSLKYNEQAGADKNVTVGPHLKPLRKTDMTYTTDASGGMTVPAGAQLAIYNSTGSVGAITVSPAVATALAPGVTDVNGNVGVPCPPNTWSYVSVWDRTFIQTTAATIMVFLINDDSTVSSK